MTHSLKVGDLVTPSKSGYTEYPEKLQKGQVFEVVDIRYYDHYEDLIDVKPLVNHLHPATDYSGFYPCRFELVQ